MTFDDIALALNEGELKLTENEIVDIAIAAFSNGEYVNCDKLSMVITNLQKVKKAAMDDYALIKKEEKDKISADKAAIGEKYFLSLKVGDRISAYMSDGTIIEGVVGNYKTGTKRAHIILDELQPGKKTLDRYTKFEFLIIPEDFLAKNVA